MKLKAPNPQGKGSVEILESILPRKDRYYHPKEIEQILVELFTSKIVLSAKFGFKPVMGCSYWLYKKDSNLRLSLIKPNEWRHDAFGEAVAKCVLQSDFTWTMVLTENALNSDEMLRYFQKLNDEFNQNMSDTLRLKESLPIYLSTLPYYQRALASNLAFSLRVSLEKCLLQKGVKESKIEKKIRHQKLAYLLEAKMK